MTSQPTESSLHNPSAWKDVKAFDSIGPFHNLQTEVVAASQRRDPLDQFPCVCPIGPNEPDAQIGIAYQMQQDFCSVTILNIGCMNDYGNNQSKCIYEEMTFAAVYLLAGIISVEPPFSVVLTDWLSRMAALGSASRPSAMRTPVRNASWTCAHIPSRRHDEK
jgi:hypothetical protein